MNITGKGMKFRWLKNAGFEMELSSHLNFIPFPVMFIYLEKV